MSYVELDQMLSEWGKDLATEPSMFDKAFENAFRHYLVRICCVVSFLGISLFILSTAISLELDEVEFDCLLLDVSWCILRDRFLLQYLNSGRLLQMSIRKLLLV